MYDDDEPVEPLGPRALARAHANVDLPDTCRVCGNSLEFARCPNIKAECTLCCGCDHGEDVDEAREEAEYRQRYTDAQRDLQKAQLALLEAEAALDDFLDEHSAAPPDLEGYGGARETGNYGE